MKTTTHRKAIKRQIQLDEKRNLKQSKSIKRTGHERSLYDSGEYLFVIDGWCLEGGF